MRYLKENLRSRRIKRKLRKATSDEQALEIERKALEQEAKEYRTDNDES